MMQTYRRKPITVKAGKFSINEKDNWPTGVCVSGQVFEGRPFVHTAHGQVELEEGDWIIQLASGECYPVKPEIFEKLYDKVEEEVTNEGQS